MLFLKYKKYSVTNAMYHHEEILKLTHPGEQRKGLMTQSQIVRAKENLKLSHCGSSYRLASDTYPLIKALRQSSHRVLGPTHRRAIKEEAKAMNRDWG